jgi:hypothetical protein
MKSSDMFKREEHSDLPVNIIVTVIDGKIERRRRRGRKRRQLVNDLNPFQSNFSANRILPSSYLFWPGKSLVELLVIILQF